jgi:hypothetical protein
VRDRNAHEKDVFNTPAAVSVIDSATLQPSPAYTPVDAFRDLPGSTSRALERTRLDRPSVGSAVSAFLLLGDGLG